MPDDGVDDTSTDSTSTDTTADTTTTDDTSTDTTTTGTDSTASDDNDAAKWKALAQKHEKASKANFAELEKLRKAQLSESEKAIEEARDAGKAEARAEAAAMIAAAELKAAGVPADDVADLDLSKFITADGTVDTDKVTATGKRFAERAKATSTGSADGGPQGKPPSDKPTTLEGAVAKALAG